MLRRFFALSCALIPAAVAAEPLRLAGSEIKDTFSGSLLALDTPLGTTIPIRFTGDGLMSGQAGSLASVLGAAQDRGRWWVTGDRLCYKWFRWFEAQSQCLTLKIKDDRVYWRQDDGTRGTATIVERAPVVLAAAAPEPVHVAVTARVPATTGPVLKSPPRLAVRPQSDAGDIAVASGELSDRGLLFVGLGLSRALESQFRVAEAAAAARDALPGRSKPVPVVAARTLPKPEKKVAIASGSRNARSNSGTAPAQSRPAPAPAPTAITMPSFSVFGVREDDVLNMRSGPSDGHAIVGQIPPDGDDVRLVGPCVDVWCQIQFGGARGWVNRYYLAENSPPTP